MDVFTLQAQVNADGQVMLSLPAAYANHIVRIVVQPTIVASELDEPVDMLGYPIGYFEKIDAMPGDDTLERPEQGEYEERDEIE